MSNELTKTSAAADDCADGEMELAQSTIRDYVSVETEPVAVIVRDR